MALHSLRIASCYQARVGSLIFGMRAPHWTVSVRVVTMVLELLYRPHSRRIMCVLVQRGNPLVIHVCANSDT